jgi:hypothetical protein
LASSPESIVICQLVKTNRNISQCSVHLHDSIARCQREYLCFRPSDSCKCEGVILDVLCYTKSLIVRVYDKT